MYLKKHGEKTNNNNPLITECVNKIENRVTFKLKQRSRSTKSKITKDENGENVPHLEITNVVLIHCNIVNNNYE